MVHFSGFARKMNHIPRSSEQASAAKFLQIFSKCSISRLLQPISSRLSLILFKVGIFNIKKFSLVPR
ncbi:MAG: hypothetical protein U5L45_16290 [Saprospiraceae bacterium]|nr:hypothetical protein [Saprospiraceae bacterium]